MQDTETTPKTLVGLTALHAAHKEAMKRDGKVAILASLAGLFARFPHLEAVCWAQYTPYFNDGDPCVFSLCEPYVKVQGIKDEDSDRDDGYVDRYGLRDEDSEMEEALTEFYEQASAIEEVFKDVFDDHSEITVTRDGVKVESYEHD